MISPTVFVLALLAAFGMFLVTASIGILHGLPLPRLTGGVSLADEAQRVAPDAPNPGTTRAQPSLLDRAVVPLAQSLAARASMDERDWLDRSLDLLDYPSYFKAPADYYTARVLFATLGFVAGAVVGGAMAVDGAVLGLLVCPLGLSMAGYHLPRLQLNGLIKARREQMLFEVPYVLDRLNVSVTAERSLAQGLIAVVSVPEGGYLMREFRQVAEDYLKNARLTDALRRMGQRNADVPLVERIAERLALSEETGADTARAMQVIGDRAHETVENLIQERGEQNNTLMILPTVIALVGIFVAIAGPSLLSFGQLLQP